MGNAIKIDDGKKTYDIVNQDNVLIGRFSFSPSDTNITRRFEQVLKNVESIKIPNVNPEDREASMNALVSVEDKLKEEINYLLNADVADNFFSILGPLSPLDNGQFFFESALDAIGQAITAETGKRMKRVNAKISKHTSKYRR